MMNIPDKWLTIALTEALGENISEASLARLQRLDWSIYRAEAVMRFGPISQLDRLEHCSQLKALSLNGNAVGSLVPLQRLSNLEEILLTSSYLTSLPDLSALQKLRDLVLDYNSALVDISGIQGFQVLRYLRLSPIPHCLQS